MSLRFPRNLSDAFNDANRASSISTPDGKIIGFPLKIKTRRPWWQRMIRRVRVFFNRRGDF